MLRAKLASRRLLLPPFPSLLSLLQDIVALNQSNVSPGTTSEYNHAAVQQTLGACKKGESAPGGWGNVHLMAWTVSGNLHIPTLPQLLLMSEATKHTGRGSAHRRSHLTVLPVTQARWWLWTAATTCCPACGAFTG